MLLSHDAYTLLLTISIAFGKAKYEIEIDVLEMKAPSRVQNALNVAYAIIITES